MTNNVFTTTDQDGILSRSTTKPVYLSKVEIEGIQNLDDDFLKTLISPLLSTSDHTVNSLNNAIRETTTNFNKTGLFEKIACSVDNDSTSLLAANIKYPFTNEVLIPTAAKFKLSQSQGTLTTLTTSTTTPVLPNSNNNSNDFNNESLFSFDFLNSNFKGYADSLLFNYTLSSINFNNNLSLSYNSPLNNDKKNQLLIDIYRSYSNNQSYSKHDQRTYSVFTGYQYSNFYDIKHDNNNNNFSYLTGLNIVQDEVLNSNTNLLENNISSKVSLINNFSYNNLGNYDPSFNSSQSSSKNLIPSSSGCSLALKSEVAGLDKSSRKFHKLAFDSTFYRSIVKNVLTFEQKILIGNIFPITIFNNSADADKSTGINVSDKFFGNLTGFKKNSIGFNKDDVYLGGNSILFKSSTLYSKFPKFLSKSHVLDPLRFRLSLQYGDIYSNVDDLKKVFQNLNIFSKFSEIKHINKLSKVFATNLSVGLFYSTKFSNLDLSYNIPLSNRACDISRPGLQFNASISMA
ncbi:uncharacterized protein ASCRUDRAFT_81319 [Ascoidea rubescens DSM 1968]|uniref:Bacterial surface antigen (D15) domain-containing protein n=1 Tax=Ascoidea rubescens DSM 1968 TaxID=1344418 RepID=A0A1D2VFN0_9ASCO|nr:hypothetical protein ASCRUDRAFT_81319 [Ascoidea rubescens DSM 1968]ODV60323.1 hypothetical protein ASCRUDRAFT_81319 [Ascoidea rubescens DSM 1968]